MRKDINFFFEKMKEQGEILEKNHVDKKKSKQLMKTEKKTDQKAKQKK